MKKLFFSLCYAVVMVFALIFFLRPAQASENVVKLRYSNFHPAMAPLSKLSEAWCKEIEKRTEGRIQFSYFPSGTLTPPTQTYDSVVKGIADVGQSLLAYAPGRLPLSEVLSLPLGLRKPSMGTLLANAYYKKFHPKEFDDVKVMYLQATDPCIFHTKNMISSVDDIKNLRIKCNADAKGIVLALGAVPLTMPVTDTYDALREGLIDGLLMAIEGMKSFRFGELVKCTLENYAPAYSAPIFVIMNKNKWNSISRTDQQTIEQINKEWIVKTADLWAELNKEAKEWLIEKGVKMVSVSKEEEARTAEKMKPVLAKYVSDMKAKGLPGDEALKFCQDYIKTHQ
jgi:TRAP-type C4-dicarboxylate transport system substrate-binding protein